jgi:hypothetical protein
MAGVDRFISLRAGKSQQPMVDGLEEDVSHGGRGSAVWPARLLEAKLGEGIVETRGGQRQRASVGRIIWQSLGEGTIPCWRIT